jgi:hypothetical protein
MKRVLFVLCGIALIAAPSFATTKTVGKSGADFTSIQAAIDSFTEAEVTDGTPDVVEIIDGEMYDEQVIIGNLIGDPDGLPDGYLDEVIDLALRSDSFTLKGSDSENRPSINPIDADFESYGVFTNDSTDYFIATLSFMGKDINIENIEILQASEISDDQYGMNGQAGNMVFNNVLFAHSGAKAPGEAFVNMNNDVYIAGKGFDNSYTFIDCTFDAAVDGVRNDNVDTFYFHGYGQGDADDAGVNIEDVSVNVAFEGCSFLNGDTVSSIRGNAQANNISFSNCFIADNKNGLVGSGQGTFTVANSIFYNNQQNGGDADNDYTCVGTTGRSGFTPALTVTNSLFVDNMSADADSLAGIPGFDFRAAAIRIKNDGTDPDITVDNCTFVNNPIAIRFTDGSGRPRNASINNNIFQNCNSAILTADDAADSYFNSVADGDSVTVLVVNGANNVFDGNNAIVENAELLPNVSLEGTEASVTFDNASIDPSDPFAGPPYTVASGAPADVGANLGGATAVSEYMIFE